MPGTKIEGVGGGPSIRGGEKFDIAIHRLACGAIHDDVDSWAKVWGDDFCMRSQERYDLGLGEVVGNLSCKKRSAIEM